jgi:hypothetical protein
MDHSLENRIRERAYEIWTAHGAKRPRRAGADGTHSTAMTAPIKACLPWIAALARDAAAEIAALRHHIERYISIANEHATEAEQLRPWFPRLEPAGGALQPAAVRPDL